MPDTNKTNNNAVQNNEKAPAPETELDVKVFLIDDPEGSTMAFASITVDKKMAYRGIRVVQGEEGLFVAMPQSKQEKDGVVKYHDIAFPVTRELHKQIRRAVLDGYKAELNKTADQSLDAELREGQGKAAEQQPAQRTAAKAHGKAALE
jgi:stage V sporulation protein G